MDSIYPPRYRYSPERLKKALSCQSDESQGRRQSEPIQQKLQNTKTHKEADAGNKENGRLPEEDEPGGPEATSEQVYPT
ncbi:pleckstrin homology domain-containing family G member 3-like [Cottoperca gobio]|uniref:Pleckstrin homology domain-containing family G member 3-like n=1 Tax=Cottoperca gobio TaxID=56716 RepID=A0A6J2P7A2_COTGO|nr:pleckstrin homology domain-containing family G member 3-like [Cottoperca gobio]